MERTLSRDGIAFDDPPEFLAALCHQAEGDAIAVTAFLEAHGFIPASSTSDVQPGRLSASEQLGIGLALRLRRWELSHIDVHLRAGMPSSDAVLRRLRQHVPGDGLLDFVVAVSIQRIKVYREHFLWTAVGDDLAENIAIVGKIDETFLDAVAEFLIAQLQSSGTPE